MKKGIKCALTCPVCGVVQRQDESGENRQLGQGWVENFKGGKFDLDKMWKCFVCLPRGSREIRIVRV